MKVAAEATYDVSPNRQRGSPAIQEAPTTYAIWKRVRIGDALKLFNGRAFKPSEWSRQGRPIVRIQNLNNPDAPFNCYDGELPAKFGLKKGDLLFAWSGTPGTSFGAHIWRGGDAWLNQHIFKVHFDKKQFDIRFLRYAINQNLNQYIAAAHGGAGLAHITKGKFEAHTIICPPLDEQKRIVAEIEKQFSCLDEAVANIERARARLSVYRASVLSGVQRGGLCGMSFRDWPVKAIGELATRVQYGSSSKTSATEKGIPVLRMGNVENGELVLDNLKYLPADHDEFPELFLEIGDVLFNRTNSPELVGKVAVYQGNPSPCSFASYLIRLRFANEVVPEFAAYVLNSPYGRAWVRSVVTQQVGQANVNGSKLKAFQIPVPPIKMQRRLVAEAERQFSLMRDTDAQLVAAELRSEKLRSKLLANAFGADNG